MSLGIRVFLFIFFSIQSFAGSNGIAVILVDMQYGFYERGGVTETQGLKDLVSHQQKLLNWAVKEDVPVLVFEFQGYQETDSRLMKILKNHPHKVVTKRHDNGFTRGSQSAQAADDQLQKWDTDLIIIAGINGAACVKGTAVGAINFGYDVTTSSDIVGNINQNPPLYPNSSWFFRNNRFDVFSTLEEIIGE